MITEITQLPDGQYTFTIGKCKYKNPDYKSLAEVRDELIKQMAGKKVR